MRIVRWTRYGKDRLYVKDDQDGDIGWFDLASDEAHPTSDDLMLAVTCAVEEWRAGFATKQPEQTSSTASSGPGQRTLDAVDGVAGGSAWQEFHRRHGNRQARVQADHPKMGKFLLAVFDDPRSTRSWSTGATGEEVVGSVLAGLAGSQVRVLNDRRIPRSPANIDHLVVCASGVYVIDAKCYQGRRPRLRIEGGILQPRQERLLVGGRDRTALVEAMHKQTTLVRRALQDHADVDVRGVLCFVGADWPLIGGSFDVQGVSVVWPKRLRELLTKPGSLDADSIADLQRHLAERFPQNRRSAPDSVRP